MSGNAEGWLIAFEKISDSTDDNNSLIIRLMNIISEMEKKAGEASRRTWVSCTLPFGGVLMAFEILAKSCIVGQHYTIYSTPYA